MFTNVKFNHSEEEIVEYFTTLYRERYNSVKLRKLHPSVKEYILVYPRCSLIRNVRGRDIERNGPNKTLSHYSALIDQTLMRMRRKTKYLRKLKCRRELRMAEPRHPF